MRDDLTKIRIMADYGDAYAWDQDGVNIGLSYNFENLPEIAAIEEELIRWSGDFWEAEDNDPDFPWEDFHKRGVDLTARLHEAIPRTMNIEISYQRPYEDPKGKLNDQKIFFLHKN
jgi:hypothetical protein